MFAIFGAGGFGRELLRPALQMQREVVFVVDHPQGPVLGIPVFRPDELGIDDEFVIALGDSRARRQVAARLNGRPGRLVAQTAVIGPDVEIGEGSVFCDYSMVTASARIGRHFQCNIYSYVAHDCVIGDFVTFGPKVCCNGNVRIGDSVYVGTGAIIRNGLPDRPLTIGEGAVIGMGAVVTKDVPAGAIVLGNPARPKLTAVSVAA
jgi:sugar O-acyltransferase (sialic acid O-acetyltransferase NeuD family)